MKKHYQALLVAVSMAAVSSQALAAADSASSDTHVSVAADTLRAGQMEIIAALPEPGPSGIAVTEGGRVFLTFPRHATDHDKPSLGELRDGKIIAWPDENITRETSLPVTQRLVSPHGLTLDTKGRLWLIDDGKVAGHPIEPGAAKIVGFDVKTGKEIANIPLHAPAMLPDSHMNDLRVDLTHGKAGTVYIADSSFGTSPGLVIVDIATGKQRRVLTHHPSVLAEPGFEAVLEGRVRRYDPHHPGFPIGGIDSITLSNDSKTLYYSPLTSRRLYSLPTALLADPAATDDKLASAVTDLGEKVMTDGLATDAWNRIYLTAGEHDSIMRRSPDGQIDVIARDPRIIWPDGIFATRTHVYYVIGQWNRLPGFNDGHNLRKPPYLIARTPITPP
ncbi:L-dopachrome tautomerase-related protein [Acetobacter thailandicus]|uniref:L-dopachrome tautomerase-related protein n=1 Tax=Acetobacter thailandicus TaxID=1502842 RepID=UPI001BA52E9A|nr:L-dopachrome tautomerase-related protein [Acetobacter thailandicus]MBS1004081.1 gluconolactonase [Acetobacter thailandicus]